MTKQEYMLQSAEDNNIKVIENYDLSGTRFKGLYCDGSIALSKELRSEAERNCILAEEIGHHFLTVGDITDNGCVENRKQEIKSRSLAYKLLIPPLAIIQAYYSGCQNKYEMAEYLDVTEDFLEKGIKRYIEIYGSKVKFRHYLIVFDPLWVIDLQESEEEE